MDTTDRARLLRVYPVLRELPAALLAKVEETAKPVLAPAGERESRHAPHGAVPRRPLEELVECRLVAGEHSSSQSNIAHGES